MQIHVGFEMIYDCPKPTPMIFNLNVHFTRVSDLVGRDSLVVDPPVPMAAYRDDFGNWCTRIVAPKGRMRISYWAKAAAWSPPRRASSWPSTKAPMRARLVPCPVRGDGQ